MRPRRGADPFLMLVPTVLLLAVFFYYPLGYAVYRSLYDDEKSYVGAQHYDYLIESGELLETFTTTLTFSVVVVLGSMFIGLLLAIALNRPGPLAAWVRGAIFSAYIVSWVSVALLWMWVLRAEDGAFTAVVESVGLPSANWLGDPDVALYTLAGVTIWKIVGYAMVLFIAGLQDIPEALYEAAALDGAGPWNRFRNVTWPLLRPTSAFVGTTSLIASFQVFDVVQVMTQGGPVRSTTVFVYAIYEQVFQYIRVGRASALVVVFFGLLLLLTGLQLLVWRRRSAA